MLEKEKYYRLRLIKKKIFFFYIFFFCFFNNYVQADIKQEIIDKFNKTETLTFNFKQKVGEKIEKEFVL